MEPALRRRRLTRFGSLAARALSNSLLASCAALFVCACEPSVPPGSPEARVAELVEALTPIDRTVTSNVQDVHFIRGQKLTQELSDAGPEVGRAALQALRERKEKVVAVERGLLTVAAHAATADTLPLLEALVTQYGASLDIRTEAALLIAEVAPKRALEILEPMILMQRQTQTMPPAEFLVKAWITACAKTGRSPVPELCAVATNLAQEESARVKAVKELGNHPDPRGEKALRAILVESTGDGYLRRMATQSLHNTLPAETACQIFKDVATREADLNFARFLGDALEKWCGW
jgi:hypothetical protein